MGRETLRPMRLQGLDRVRAGAMLLGVVYHATYAFVPGIGPWFPVQARSTWEGFAVLAAVLHSMRMPVFFCVSGFFAALVMDKRADRFLRDRFKRLMVPFFVALPLSIVSDRFIRAASLAQGTMDAGFPGQGDWLFRPLHLWFLELVFLFCALAWLLGKTKLTLRLEPLVRVPEVLLGGAVLSWATVALAGEPQPAFSFVPTVGTIVFFAPFFALGWGLHAARRSTEALQRRTWWMVPAALALALFVFTRPLQWQPLGHALAALIAWLMVVGVVGLALRPGASERPGVLVQSAYWVYLVHHPLVQSGQVLVAKQSWPAWVGYLVVVVGAFSLSFVTFLLFVRPTRLAPWLGATTAQRPPA